MITSAKTSDTELEGEILFIERELANLSPPLSLTPVVDKNVIAVAFNKLAGQTMAAYGTNLQRYKGLERRLDYLRRRLQAIRTHNAYALDFAYAA